MEPSQVKESKVIADKFFDEFFATDIPQFIIDCPISAHWVVYNGKTKFAMLNYEESIKRGKAMIDLCYCATAGLINNHVEKTVPYSKARFKGTTL
jgi:hypothetical protein